MAKVSTKQSAKRKAAKRARRVRDVWISAAMYCVVALFIVSFATLCYKNAQSNQMPEGEWYVEGGQFEILAAPVAGTLDVRQEQSLGLPFLEPAPTAAPRATRKPLPDAIDEPLETPASAFAPDAGRANGESVELTITAVGDCTLGGNVPNGADKVFASYVRRYGYDYFFQNVRALFESDDLTIVNLEGPLTNSADKREGRTFNFRGDPEYVNILSGSSVEICNVANNHALDYGDSGYSETCAVLKEAGIGVSGFSNVDMRDVNGVRVCTLGFTEWAYSETQIIKTVKLARANCDLLIVSMHWGEEGVHTTTQTQKKLGHAIIDAGADVILGTHPHVYGGVEQYNGKYIVYSLGNFCFGGNRNPSDKDSLIFRQTFSIAPDGTVSDAGIDLIPARISGSNTTNDFQPHVLSGDKGMLLLNSIYKVSEMNGGQVLWSNDSYQVQSGIVPLSAG